MIWEIKVAVNSLMQRIKRALTSKEATDKEATKVSFKILYNHIEPIGDKLFVSWESEKESSVILDGRIEIGVQIVQAINKLNRLGYKSNLNKNVRYNNVNIIRSNGKEILTGIERIRIIHYKDLGLALIFDVSTYTLYIADGSTGKVKVIHMVFDLALNINKHSHDYMAMVVEKNIRDVYTLSDEGKLIPDKSLRLKADTSRKAYYYLIKIYKGKYKIVKRSYKKVDIKLMSMTEKDKVMIMRRPTDMTTSRESIK